MEQIINQKLKRKVFSGKKYFSHQLTLQNEFCSYTLCRKENMR